MKMFVVVNLAFLVLFIANSALSVDLPGPPELAKELVKDTVNAKKGDDIKLICPVKRQKKVRLFFEWDHLGHVINAQMSRRYRQSKNYLLIRNVSTEDTGTYRCQAINGFGNLYFTIQLDVEDPYLKEQEIATSSLSKHKKAIEIPEGQAKPTFLQLTRAHRMIIQRPAGSAVRIKCMAIGTPQPVVTWLKDGKPLKSSDLNSVSKIRKYTLHLVDVQGSDSGVYVCKSTNKWGEINATYTIEVIDKIKVPPQLIGPHPINNSVVEGGRASFLCKMHSESLPHIQWLKRVEKKSDSKDKVFELNGVNYKIFNATEVVQQGKMFLNKLVLDNIAEEDAGYYACFGANSMGYNNRFAHLTVIKRRTYNDQPIIDGIRNNDPIGKSPVAEYIPDDSAPTTLGSNLYLWLICVIVITVVIIVVFYRFYHARKSSPSVSEPTIASVGQQNTMVTLPKSECTSQTWIGQYAPMKSHELSSVHSHHCCRSYQPSLTSRDYSYESSDSNSNRTANSCARYQTIPKYHIVHH